MQIADYIKEKGLTWKQFADLCDISRQTVYLIMTEKQPPSLRTIDKIVAATNGAIKFDELRFNHQPQETI